MIQNPMVAVARASYGWTQGHAKQPGRRYGPAPESSISGQGQPKRGHRWARRTIKAAERASLEAIDAIEG